METVIVLDGGALLYRVAWTKNSTFETILKNYVSHINNMVGKSGRKLVVFDGYITSSTKDHCHSKRAPVQSLDHSVSLEKQVLCRKEVVLSNPRNKQEFITALTAALIDAGYDVFRSDTDADHDIVVKAIAELDTGPTVIVRYDTDLLVLAIYYYRVHNPDNKLYMYTVQALIN